MLVFCLSKRECNSLFFLFLWWHQFQWYFNTYLSPAETDKTVFPEVKYFFKAVTPVIMHTVEYLNTLHCQKSRNPCTMWCNHYLWCWYRPTAYHSFLELTKGQLCLFYFSVWVNWKLVGDAESRLWQIRSKCDESSLQWSGYGGCDFDFPVLLLSGKKPSLTWESRLSVFVYFLRAVFLLNSRRPTEVCVCAHACVCVCVCVTVQ